MKSMHEKYMSDNSYRYTVDAMEAMIHQCHFTPSEMREMAVLACIHYEATRSIPPYIKPTSKQMTAFEILEKARKAEAEY